jgi:ABC-2 type transport system permease protein
MSLLLLSTILVLRLSARVFRIGLLLYGKSPNLPEILRWARAS